MKTTIRFLLVLLATLAPAGAASAQTGALVSGTVQFFQNGAALPSQTTTIPLPSGVQCGQPLLPGVPGTPPISTTARLIWSDPANPNLICIAVAPAGSTIFALPIGSNYSATMTFTDDLGRTSPPSAPSNSFSRLGPLGAPTGFQVRP
jgi:hypothetical protein